MAVNDYINGPSAGFSTFMPTPIDHSLSAVMVSGTQTPSYMVGIFDGTDDTGTALLTSTIADGDTAWSSTGVLLYFRSEETNRGVGIGGAQKATNHAPSHSLLELHLQAEAFVPTLRIQMRNAKPVYVALYRVKTAQDGQGQLETVSATTFNYAYIESIVEDTTRVVVLLSVLQRSDAYTNPVSSTNEESENIAADWDYTQGCSGGGGGS